MKLIRGWVFPCNPRHQIEAPSLPPDMGGNLLEGSSSIYDPRMIRVKDFPSAKTLARTSDQRQIKKKTREIRIAAAPGSWLRGPCPAIPTLAPHGCGISLGRSVTSTALGSAWPAPAHPSQPPAPTYTRHCPWPGLGDPPLATA